MDKLFEQAFNYLLLFEGGFSDDKNDKGGITKFGISERSYPNIDITQLTLEEAKNIYYEDFWLKNKCDKIIHTKVAIKLFDISVNTGLKVAARILQRAVRASGIMLSEDGIIGEKTINSVNKIDGGILLSALKSEIAGYYRIIITKNDRLKVFENGWLNRAYADIDYYLTKTNNKDKL